MQPDQTRLISVRIVNVQSAKTHLSRLIEEAAAGEEIVIGKHGKPMARLCAYLPRKQPRPLGGLEGRIQIASDFDAEDPSIERAFYRDV
jgi:prevent-host-death family protein